jgi:hypothetical protein
LVLSFSPVLLRLATPATRGGNCSTWRTLA